MFCNKLLDIHTQKSLKLKTVLSDNRVSSKKNLRKLISFCAHFLCFNFIPRRQEKPDVSLTTIGIRLGEYLGNIPGHKISSTDLILQYQSLS